MAGSTNKVSTSGSAITPNWSILVNEPKAGHAETIKKRMVNRYSKCGFIRDVSKEVDPLVKLCAEFSERFGGLMA